MSHTNYAIQNEFRKQKKEIAKEIEAGNPAYNLYVESILKESEKAYKLNIETREVFNARTLDGYESEYIMPPLTMWIPKSILNSAPTENGILDCFEWKLVELNMTFIAMLFAQMQ